MLTKKIFNKKSINPLKILGLAGIILLSSCNKEEIITDEDYTVSAAKAASSVKLTYDNISVSEEQLENPIENIDDKSTDTRWAAEGASVNLDIDFKEIALVDYLKIDFHKGEERAFKFSYWQSGDGQTWELKGTKNSSGVDTGYEEFDLSNITARYFRIEFQGNEFDNWNSISELEIYGLQNSKTAAIANIPYTTLSVSVEEPENPIEHINDGSLETRWAGEGESVNLDIDFEKEILIDHLKIDFHKGEERAFKFSYWQSIDGTSWELKGTTNSSGDNTGYETFNLSDITTRYFRIEFQGNEFDNWNSLLELEVYGTSVIDGVTPNKISYTTLSAPGEEPENPIEHINDGILDTRWTAEGESINLDIDLKEAILIDHLKIDFHKGEERAFKFSYWHSNDGDSWVLKGTKTSSGEDTGYEEFNLSNISTRYFRIEFQGNEFDNWNSISELEIYGTPAEETILPNKISYNTLAISEEEVGNPITNINDEEFETRWSGYGDAINFDIDLKEEIFVDYLNIAFYKASERAFTFSYWQSVDGITWELKGEYNSSTNITNSRYEQFDLTGVTTRYLRIQFQGNEYDLWNSVQELEVYGSLTGEPIDVECIVTTPSGLANDVTSNSVVLSWNTIANIDFYSLRYRALGTDTWLYNTSIEDVTFTLTDLSSDSEYEWQLRSECADGLVSDYEEAVSTFTTEPEENCSTTIPVELLSEAGFDSAILSWDPINGINHFSLRYRILGSDTWLYNTSIEDVTFTLTDLSSDSEYEWQLRSECADGLTSDYEEATSTFTTKTASDCTATAPTGLLSEVEASTVVLSWDAIDNIRHYNLRYRVIGSDVWLYNKSITETTFTLVDLLPGSEYEWQLKSECPDGLGSDYKEAAGTFTIEIDNSCIATAPTGLLSNVGTDSVILSWNAIDNIRHYNLRHRVIGSDVWLYNKSITETTFTLSDLLSNSEYEWQLKSECNDGLGSDYKEAASSFITEQGPIPGGSLDPNKYPAENFDLSQWKITLSSGDDYSVSKLNDNFEYDNQFYTTTDGGMVFKNYPKGAGTTTNSTYSRVELREMLRGTNEDIDTKGINKNNWVFSSSSSTNQSKSGGVGGKLTATLAVNRVTTTSDSDNQLGRIVIGQIHASDNEPIRLYYKKMPGDSKGAIYFVHEDSKSVEAAVNIIGDYAIETKGDSAGDYTGASQPSNGIPLGEVFSYKIEVIGTMLYVDIYRDSGNFSGEYDMKDSGYADDWMYFKAGLYSQNKTVQSSSDYEQVTFYALENTH